MSFEDIGPFEALVVDALVRAGNVEDPMREPIFEASKVVECSHEEMRAYVEALLNRKVVQICETTKGERAPGMEPFPKLRYWARVNRSGTSC